jgi:hypothetical protein
VGVVVGGAETDGASRVGVVVTVGARDVVIVDDGATEEGVVT